VYRAQQSRLYRNNRDGTFADVTARSGLRGGGWSAGCGFADYDRDGRLDLFVSRYVKIDLKRLPEFGKDKTCEYRGIPVQCGPRGLEGESDFLFHNDGDLRFSEVAAKAGVSDPKGYFGLGVAWFDANADGLLEGSPVANLSAWQSAPLLGEAPSFVPRDPDAPSRLLLLAHLEADPRDDWDRFRGWAKEIDGSGVMRTIWCGPWIPTIIGTDTYTDQLW
jgi:hypothetical protein